MNSFLRSLVSIIIGVLLWAVLGIAFLFFLFFAIETFPTVVGVINLALSVLRAEYWSIVLLTGVPMIIPAIVIKLIMRSTSDQAHKWTLFIFNILIVVLWCFLQRQALRQSRYCSCQQLSKRQPSSSSRQTFFYVVPFFFHAPLRVRPKITVISKRGSRTSSISKNPTRFVFLFLRDNEKIDKVHKPLSPTRLDIGEGK